MKESYCGLCDTCQLDNPDLMEALLKLSIMWNNSLLIFGDIAFWKMRVFLSLNLLRLLIGFSANPNALDVKYDMA